MKIAMPYRFLSIYFDKDIIEGRAIDIFKPESVKQDTALFFVHGGGWHSGTRALYHKIMRAFNEYGFICASTDYRLNDVTIFDQITDIRHGYDVFTGILAAEGRSGRIFVYGGSAGAHLASLLTLAEPGECGETAEFGDYVRQNEWIKPVGAAFLSMPVIFEPWEDIFPIIWQDMQKIIGVPYTQRPDLYRKVSPINYISGQTPPVLLLQAENEHMFPLEQTQAFIDKARYYGCHAEHRVYTKAEHGFFYDVERRQQREAFVDILKFVTRLK
jgi:acetyl esterase/lipase